VIQRAEGRGKFFGIPPPGGDMLIFDFDFCVVGAPRTGDCKMRIIAHYLTKMHNRHLAICESR